MVMFFGGVFVCGWVLTVVAMIVGRISSGRTGYESNERIFGVFDRFELSQWKGHMPKRLYAAVYYSVTIGVALMCIVLVSGSLFGLWRNLS